MALDQFIDDELQDQLSELYHDTIRERERGGDLEAIQTRLDDFEMAWYDKIQEVQAYEIQGNKIAVEHAVKEMGHSSRFETYFRDTMQLKVLSPEGQIEFWDKYRAANPVTSEHEQARQIQYHTREIVAATNERYHQLRLDLARSMEDIAQGREPQLMQTTQHEFYETRRMAANSDRNEVMELFNQEREKHRQNDRER